MNERRPNACRWFQLSLRSIFLLILLVAAYFAGYRTAVRHGEQARQAEREARLEAERSAAEAQVQLLRARVSLMDAARLRERIAVETAAISGQDSATERVEPQDVLRSRPTQVHQR
jgi:hypothetical protein